MNYKILFISVLFLIVALPSVAQINELKYLESSKKEVEVDSISGSEIKRLTDLKDNLTPSLQKLSSDLLQLINPEFLPRATSLENHTETMKSLKHFILFEYATNFEESITEGEVYVYVYLEKGNSTSVINAFVEKVTDRDEKNNLAVAWVKVKNIEALASLDAVRTVRTVMPPIKRTGSVTTEGDAVHRTANVRTIYGDDGTGINVGIISDGVNSRDEAQATDDLPSDGFGLTVLSDTYGGDEGTAMLEIVHDMVPGAELFFHDLGGNTLAFNSAIDDLVNVGCDIICDDIGWLLEPFYEDGVVASHINSVINSNDIIYVSSAGNAGLEHYQGDFFSLSGFPTVHDFSGVNSSTPFLYVELSPGENVIVVLQWNDQFGASGNDYDLELRLHSTSQLVAQSAVLQNGTQDPLEALSYTNPSTTQTRIYHMRAINYQGLAAVRNLEVFFYPGGGISYINNIKPENSIFGHPAIDGVVSVGVVWQSDPDTIEYFSSQGPSTIEYPFSEIRQTPKIVGVDGVAITGAGGFSNPFFGTSAAAPHVAAILAQAWSVNPSYTPSQIKQFMYDWPIDLGAAGFDNIYGFGRADALEMFQNTPLPVELSSFTAKVLKSGGVKLDWRTETEVDNYGFEIERSQMSNVSGQTKWGKIGFEAGHGNSNSPKEYSFTDKNATYTKYAYRLKQIDTDGDFEYSNIVEVDAGNIPNGFVLEQNYPNPFNPSTTIKFAIAETQKAELKIFDILGNEVATLFSGIADGGKVYEVEFNSHSESSQSFRLVRNLSSGIYLYQLKTESKVENRKMLLIK